MARLLITGGAGFIGTHLAKSAHDRDHEVCIFDNLSPQIHPAASDYAPPAGCTFIKGDVTVRADLEAVLGDVDCIVHLAAETGTGQSMYEIDRYYRVNVQGTALMFDILANCPHRVSRFVLASSRAVYGEGAYTCPSCADGGRHRPGARPPRQLAERQWDPVCAACGNVLVPVATRESDPPSPASIYAASKLGQEDLVSVACGSLGIAATILRFQNVYGEGQSLSNPYTGILSIFSTRARLGLSLPIFEDGAATRDFVHVNDVVAAIAASIERGPADAGPLNVGMGRPTTIMEVATRLARLMDAKLLPQVTGEYRIGDIRHNHADIGKIGQLLGFTPTVDLETGLERFCDWVRLQPVPPDLLEKANAELRARNMMG